MSNQNSICLIRAEKFQTIGRERICSPESVSSSDGVPARRRTSWRGRDICQGFLRHNAENKHPGVSNIFRTGISRVSRTHRCLP
jgi:hypothetical protein